LEENGVLGTVFSGEAYDFARATSVKYQVSGEESPESYVSMVTNEMDKVLKEPSIDPKAYLAAVIGKSKLEVSVPANDAMGQRRVDFFAALVKALATKLDAI
jgi:UDP-N-acetylglucosamine enolpyruvyl transferase